MEHARHYGKLRLIAGNANPILAERIAAELGQPLEKAQVGRFADGEIQVDWESSVRGSDVFIIQAICQTHKSPLRRSLSGRSGCRGGPGDDLLLPVNQ